MHFISCSIQSSLEAASATVNDVTTTIMAQRMELDNKSKTIEMLQKALNQQRELTIYHAKEIEKEGKERLHLQKTEYEATIKRHQCFIDQVFCWSCYTILHHGEIAKKSISNEYVTPSILTPNKMTS